MSYPINKKEVYSARYPKGTIVELTEPIDDKKEVYSARYPKGTIVE